ncbi:unnamed protein product [Prunus armeniaca]|nr:unnamed protein product [Prunus armeniaca]
MFLRLFGSEVGNFACDGIEGCEYGDVVEDFEGLSGDPRENSSQNLWGCNVKLLIF